jgi:hypothetical protein
MKERNMTEKIDKAKKYVSVWAVSADRLKRLSDETHMTMVELFHEALQLLEAQYHPHGQAALTTVIGVGPNRTVVGTYQDAAKQHEESVSSAAETGE